ncbi:MAG: leucine--tRNA ligase [Candidatus Delongbacteria bacterium]|nr:leucine--tRNA ligase [Candidatus Delongbacteria bacterium]MBN2835747.1 leucine--tRNA ligase [Candidatus Delongbacteria bacterium]
MAYPFKEIEKKWQAYWEKENINSTDMSKTENKYFTFCMFPYPSGDRLHLGHWFQYSCPDAHARYMKMSGKNVFQPIGYDSFGLPAENHALKTGIHPAISTNKNIEIFTKQYKGIGGMFDWDHLLATSDPEYYKWTQWIFLKLYENGLAYQKEAPANWCPECSTVVANAEVQADGTHERCGTIIEKKPIKGWFFKITDYCERLIEGLDRIDFPEKTKTMQRNWIGKSEGAKVKFQIADSNKYFEIFTTRPDTLYGVTYCTIAPELELVDEICSEGQREAIKQYREEVKTLSDIDRQSTVREKTGVFTGAYAINPVNGDKVPIWTSDYVLSTYGTGCVMAVPAHDERDFEFAKKFNLPIKVVINPIDSSLDPIDMANAYTVSGVMIESAEFTGMDSDEGLKAIIDKLEKDGTGERSINYRLRDWSVSRQRYWGVPIPFIHCECCGAVPVPENELPVTLPMDENIDYRPKGKAPLSLIDSYMNVKCPKCGKDAKRDPETMDTFVDSSWYFLRYINPHISNKAFDSDEVNNWLPADLYIGGAEHSNGHLIYSRFVTKVLYDLGYINFDEPYKKLIHQGMITRNGAKMSKSKGNAVSPDNFVDQYGTDVFRLYIMFMTNFREGGDWSDEGISGTDRFLNRIWRQFAETTYENGGKLIIDKDLNFVLHNTIKEMRANLEDLYFNTAISRLMELFNELNSYVKDENRFNADFYHQVKEKFILLLAPLAPHTAEELWSLLGNTKSVFFEKYPECDEKALVKSTQVIVVQVNGKVRANIEAEIDIDDEKVKELALADEKVLKFTEGLNIVKTILINRKDGKMVNIVVK